MKRIQCYDRNGNSINSLSQYDHDIKIYIYDLEQGIQPRVQFVHSKEIDNTYEAYNNVLSDGIGYRITIPDTFLQKAGQLICFVCYEDGDFVTKYYIAIPINTKPNPTTGFYENDIEFIDYYFLSKEIDEVRDTVEENKRLFDAHITDMGNPHKVTKNQVGLGNVPNVTTNNQEPTYTQASVLENIVSGETLSASMGKIQKVIDESMKHFADKENPHELTTEQINAVNISQLGIANGVATLDVSGKVPASQLPSYVDDVIEGYLSDDKNTLYSDEGMTQKVEPESNKIYVNLRNENTYRWSGNIYVEISESLALGETENTAYRGDRGKIAYTHSQSAHARVDATLTQASSTNGNVLINGEETVVYTPEDVINSSTQAALDGITASVTAVDEKVDELAENGLAANIDLIKEALRDVFYPIGTIYESVNATNPSEFIGGTWISWGAGRVSVGVDTSQAEFNTVEKTGGEKTHTLTVDEMPKHDHTVAVVNSINYGGSNSAEVLMANVLMGDKGSTDYTGNGQPHNNLQPYITSYKWKRTA